MFNWKLLLLKSFSKFKDKNKQENNRRYMFYYSFEKKNFNLNNRSYINLNAKGEEKMI